MAVAGNLRGTRGISRRTAMEQTLDGLEPTVAEAPAHAMRCEVHGVWFRGPGCPKCANPAPAPYRKAKEPVRTHPPRELSDEEHARLMHEAGVGVRTIAKRLGMTLAEVRSYLPSAPTQRGGA